jgi:hypothetical protein
MARISSELAESLGKFSEADRVPGQTFATNPAWAGEASCLTTGGASRVVAVAITTRRSVAMARGQGSARS